MFRSYSDEFIEILDARPVTSNLQTLFSEPRAAHDRFAVLDLGCGSGRLLLSLAKFATLVVGFDYSPELLAAAARTSRGSPNIVLVRGDARALKDIFVDGEFDAVVRAFTSLGYFTRNVERQILQQCAAITRPKGKLLVDSFNKAWFENHPPIFRTTVLDGFTLEEHYEWDRSRSSISCVWRYHRASRDPVEIPFTLEGYGLEEIVSLLDESGWRVTAFLEDLVSCTRISDPAEMERIVVLAERV